MEWGSSVWRTKIEERRPRAEGGEALPVGEVKHKLFRNAETSGGITEKIEESQ